MEDMSEKIKELLSDEESMKQINELAQMFTDSSSENGSENNTEGTGKLPIDAEKLIKIQGIVSKADGGNAAALLTALRPLLKEDRRERVDRAVKILRLIAVWEVLKESGMMEDLL